MSGSRKFFEIHGKDDPQAPDTLLGFIQMTWRDMGKQITMFRAWPTWKRAGRFFGANTVLAVAVFLLVPGDLRLKLALTWVSYCMFSGVYFTCTAIGAVWYRHRVCENGLILGRRRGRFLVPWETIDPGRVHVVENLTSAGHHLEFSSEVSPTHRAGLVDRGLVVCGLNTVRWEPMYAYWLLGTRSPEKLAMAIEKAMVDAGFDAEGLAANASRTAVRGDYRQGKAGEPLLPPLRHPLDRVIGVPRPQ